MDIESTTLATQNSSLQPRAKKAKAPSTGTPAASTEPPNFPAKEAAVALAEALATPSATVPVAVALAEVEPLLLLEPVAAASAEEEATTPPVAAERAEAWMEESMAVAVLEEVIESVRVESTPMVM